MPISLSPEAFMPPHPLHFLTIIRYISIVLILFVVIAPREGGGTIFLILLGVTALLIVADVYGSSVITQRLAVFLIRVSAVVVPFILAGSGTDKSTRQIMVVVALLGLPSILIMLFLPYIDPSLA